MRSGEKVSGRSRQNTESPQWVRKNGRVIVNAPHQEGGQSGKRHAAHVAKVRSNNRGPEGAANERTGKSGSTAGEARHRPKPPVPVVGRVLEEQTVLWNCWRRRQKRA